MEEPKIRQPAIVSGDKSHPFKPLSDAKYQRLTPKKECDTPPPLISVNPSIQSNVSSYERIINQQ